MTDRPHRGTIFVEDAEVRDHRAYPGEQFVLRLHAPGIASRALPGSFGHLSCGPGLPMRRPLSFMRASREEGWVDFLYKVTGEGTRSLSQREPGERVSVMGPIGRPFAFDPARPRPLLLGGGVGIPPMVFAAETLHRDRSNAWQPLVMMGSEIPFPFDARPSEIVVPGIPDGAVACMPLLDDWGIASRLSSRQGYPGCFDGHITDLARAWLGALPDDARAGVGLYGCGPVAMLRAVAALAREFDLPCQVALEEFMACAVGGCAGCTVEVRLDDGTSAMKRVCVDGPVFDSRVVMMLDD